MSHTHSKGQYRFMKLLNHTLYLIVVLNILSVGCNGQIQS